MTGSTPLRGGLLAGAAFRHIRGSIGASQEDMAELLRVDLTTVKGWETGRRPLTARRHSEVIRLHRQLLHLGAEPKAIDNLERGMEVDWLLAELADPDLTDLATHPLATWVNDRSVSRMLGWAFGGPIPAGFTAGSPPHVTGPERDEFFAHLQRLAERSQREEADETRGALLRQQVYFMLHWAGRASLPWLDEMEAAERRDLATARPDSPRLILARAIAVNRANQGDPEPLRRFIDTTLAEDAGRIIDLNYWAHWAGESGAAQSLAEFATTDLKEWAGGRLYGILVGDIEQQVPHVDLCAHSLWSLIQRRPHLLARDGTTTGRLTQAIDTLAGSDMIAPATKRKLDQLHFAASTTRTLEAQ